MPLSTGKSLLNMQRCTQKASMTTSTQGFQEATSYWEVGGSSPSPNGWTITRAPLPPSLAKALGQEVTCLMWADHSLYQQ